MRGLRSVAIAVAVATLVACGGPRFDDGDFRCGPALECPPDFACVEGLCRQGAVSADAGDDAPRPMIYAHDPATLYRIDPPTLALAQVGTFQYPVGVSGEVILDLALSRSGAMVASAVSTLYQVDPATATCTPVGGILPEQITGLTFIMEGDAEVLIGCARGGSLYRFDASYAASVAGALGLGGCDGDVAWNGDRGELVGTIYVDALTSTTLARIDASTGQTTAIGDTGRTQLFGLVGIAGALYAFTGTREILTLDPATGAVLNAVPTPGITWYGAAAAP